jgi:hypothetical protein
MIRLKLTVIISVLFAWTFLVSNSVCAQTERDSRLVRSILLELGTGPDTRMEVELKDHTKLEGYLVEIEGNYFLIANPGTHEGILIEYVDVLKLKGHNLSIDEDLEWELELQEQ